MADGAAVDLFCTIHSVPCKVLHITVSPLSSGSILNVQSPIAALGRSALVIRQTLSFLVFYYASEVLRMQLMRAEVSVLVLNGILVCR